jgi:hypothetical protein
MTDYNTLRERRDVRLSGSVDPLVTTIAEVTDTYRNTTSFEVFTCINIVGSDREWAGTQGTFVLSIVSPNHPNLIVMYTMDSISGSTLVDESLNNNDGSITGATAVTGKIDDALTFSRTAEDRVTSIATTGTASDGFTICGWLKFDNNDDPVGNAGIWSQWRSGQRSWLLTQAQTSGNDLEFVVSSDGAAVAATITVGETTIDVGVYGFYVIEFVPSVAIRLFKDNSEISSDTTAIPATLFNSTAPFEMGQYFNDATNRAWDGDQDQVRIFNRVLTAAEKTTLFNSGVGA